MKSKLHMKVNNYKNIKVPVLLTVFIVVLFFGCNDKTSKSGNFEIKKVNTENDKKTEEADELALEPPPLFDGIFLCDDCHADLVPNPVRKELTDMHYDIIAISDQDSADRWCLDCHDMNSRDSLKLTGGKLLAFKESHDICGQCHGEKLREWEVGVHGKKIGEWNGEKEYLLRVPRDNPHTPKFKELTPEPPPLRQEDIN